MIKLQRFKENLHQLDVFMDDPLSFTDNGKYLSVINIPQIVTIGKSAFLVGGTEYLKTSTVIKVELLDSEGNVIYTEPVDASYSQASYKPISIVVYGDEAEIGGQCTLTIVAEITHYDDNGIKRPVPDNWKGLYNYRWRTNLFLDKTTAVNTQPIKFYKHPKVEVSEQITPYVTVSGSVSQSTHIFKQGVVEINSNGQINAKAWENNSGGYEVTQFNSSMVGGIVRIKAHKDTTSGSIAGATTFYGLENDFTASIIDVVSNIKLQTNLSPGVSQCKCQAL